LWNGHTFLRCQKLDPAQALEILIGPIRFQNGALEIGLRFTTSFAPKVTGKKSICET
jgi:hypothetical protein